MAKPLVSVVIPTHNRPAMCAEAIASARRQTVPVEVVVVDASDEFGGGGDIHGGKWKTLGMPPEEVLGLFWAEHRAADAASEEALAEGINHKHVKEFRERNAQFAREGLWASLGANEDTDRGDHYQRLRRDPGLLACWYVGVAQARGEYVTILPDDDWLEPTFAERCLAAMTPEVGAVITEGMVRWGGAKTDHPNLGLRAPTSVIPSNIVLDWIVDMPFTITPACQLVRRADVLDCLAINQPAHCDHRSPYQEAYMTLGIVSRYPRVHWIADPLVNLRAHPESITIAAMADGAKDLREAYKATKQAWLAGRDT